MCVACNTAKNVVGKVVGVVPKRKGRKGKITILDSTTLKVVAPLLLSLSHTHTTHTGSRRRLRGCGACQQPPRVPQVGLGFGFGRV